MGTDACQGVPYTRAKCLILMLVFIDLSRIIPIAQQYMHGELNIATNNFRNTAPKYCSLKFNSVPGLLSLCRMGSNEPRFRSSASWHTAEETAAYASITTKTQTLRHELTTAAAACTC